MSYFNNFPKVVHPFTINGKEIWLRVIDIALNVRIRSNILGDISLYDYYDIVDGDSPEIISEKLYGDPNYHWVIMLVNYRFDRNNDFPLSAAALDRYIIKKYGADKINDVHKIYGELHYEDKYGNIVDYGTPNSFQVTNYDFEFRENEKKRRIKILHQNVIYKLVSEIEDAFKEYVEK